MATLLKSFRRIKMQDLYENTPLDSEDLMCCSMKLKKKYGNGFLLREPICEGLSYFVYNIVLNEDSCIFNEDGNNYNSIWFYSCLSGKANLTFQNRGIMMKTGCSEVFVGGYDRSIKDVIKKDKPYKVVGVVFTPEKFLKVTGKSPDQLYQIRSGNGSELKMPVEMHFAAKQLYEARNYSGINKKLFYEAKALEIISYKIGQLESHEDRKNSFNERSYAESIYYAAELMEKNMISPPGIYELARDAGLCHNRLICGFKEILGCTPYEYLSEIRLQKAAELIAKREQNVTEAAISVGYSSLSHFAKIFRRKYGMNPGECAKKGFCPCAKKDC